MNVRIRPARREDCPRLLALVRELADFERAPEAVTVSETHFEASGFGSQPVWWALVAEAEGVVIGFALWYIRFSTWKGQRLYLEDLYVTESWRGRGVGTALFESLVAEGKSRGFSGAGWQVLDWNEPAIRFYEKLGASFDGAWLNVGLEF